MNVTPRTEKELEVMDLIEAGTYPFEVVYADERTSKSGNAMIEIRLKVWDKDGRERTVYDYLLDAFAKKIKHFADVSGLIDKYNEGSISASDCLGKCGSVEIIIQDGQNGYSAKNSVKDYVVSPTGESKKPIHETHPAFSDDIPF